MNFVDEDTSDINEQKKKDKLPIIAGILLIAIIIVLILIVVVYSAINKQKGTELTLSLDGSNNGDFKNILVIEDDGTIYVPIRDSANYFGYSSYNGNYVNKSENSNECYVESQNEIVTFVANSNEIEKINPTNSETTYFTIDKPIKTMNNKLYVTIDGLETVYNLKASYDKNKNKIILETMDYITEQNKQDILDNGFKDISKRFDDTKAILKGLVIVISNSNQYGLYNIETKQTILEAKYDNIEYVPFTEDFTIKSNGSVGIKDSTGRDKIQTRYESIEFVSQQFKLYVVKKDNKYGVIDSTESTIIPIIYDKIGIDATNFRKNGIKNKYVLVNKIIPVMKNSTWALFDINGIALTDFLYKGIGCVNNSGENLVVIPDYNVIVAAKDKKYVVLTDDGKEVWGGKTFDQVYLQFQNGNPSYYLVTNNRTYDAVTYLGKTLGTSTNTNNSNANQSNNKGEREEENNNSNTNNRQDNDDEEQNTESREQNNNRTRTNRDDEEQREDEEQEEDEEQRDDEEQEEDEEQRDDEEYEEDE